MENSAVDDNFSPPPPPPPQNLMEYDVYGRDYEKETILKLLLSNDNNVSVIPILGMAGVGKTTLAHLLYEDLKVNRHFDLKAWVCVSDEFDLLRNLRAPNGNGFRHLRVQLSFLCKASGIRETRRKMGPAFGKNLGHARVGIEMMNHVDISLSTYSLDFLQLEQLVVGTVSKGFSTASNCMHRSKLHSLKSRYKAARLTHPQPEGGSSLAEPKLRILFGFQAHWFYAANVDRHVKFKKKKIWELMIHIPSCCRVKPETTQQLRFDPGQPK
ncbi:hypothetical protein FEM48_Zijuj09G0202000 [Ziziphus jujuba var. spinosa]|uniref:NB-ARC domain-containing protein n=1 Tax=Ziziphus jujuba var. spinosa TaxID=714518 RepID=A0A978UV29_ZIZJJ|nr:hypothetical protein FEM48_Zijuj09G0202000 [Ziziphus jujuba var. spinosa]